MMISWEPADNNLILRELANLKLTLLKNISREILNYKPNSTSMKAKHSRNWVQEISVVPIPLVVPRHWIGFKLQITGSCPLPIVSNIWN